MVVKVHGNAGYQEPLRKGVDRGKTCDQQLQFELTAGQTGGKLLADRSLSRLLNKDWPKTIDELEKIQPRPKK